MLEGNIWETPAIRSPPTTVSTEAGPYQDVLFTFRRHSRVLVAWILVCVAVAGLYLAAVPPEYSASAYVVLNPGQATGNSPSPAGITPAATLDNPQVETQVAVATSANVLRFVFDERRLQNDPDFLPHPSWPRQLLSQFLGQPMLSQLLGQPSAAADRSDDLAFAAFVSKVSARRIGQSYVLEISFRSGSAARAASIANSITAAYIRDQINATMLSLRANGTLYQGRMDDIKAQQEEIAEAVRSGAPPRGQFPASDARIISSAAVPFAKSYPQRTLTLAAALTFSLLTGLGAISIFHALDQKVRTRRQLSRELHIDCFAVFPKLTRNWSVPALATTLKLALAESNPFTESMRELRACVIGSEHGKTPRIIGLVSTARGEGKSAISAGLARSLSSSGRRTVLVDADLRTGSLTRILAPDSPCGLVSGPFAQNFAQVLTKVCNFFFLPAGSDRELGGADDQYLPANTPAAIVDSLHSFDYVILDLPARESYSDVKPLASILESCVLVVESGRCGPDELRGTVDSLARLNVKVLGAVLNKQSRIDSSKP
jgi:succinoglycan biosynthesis transport protein ExoP